MFTFLLYCCSALLGVLLHLAGVNFAEQPGMFLAIVATVAAQLFFLAIKPVNSGALNESLHCAS